MALFVLFLITSIFTARFFEKNKMHLASVLYSVWFTVLLILLSFSFDVPLLTQAWTNLIGAQMHQSLHIWSLQVLTGTFCGVSAYIIITFVLAFQLGIIIYSMTKKVVYRLLRRDINLKLSIVFVKRIQNARVFYSYFDLNRLYCRMLN